MSSIRPYDPRYPREFTEMAHAPRVRGIFHQPPEYAQAGGLVRRSVPSPDRPLGLEGRGPGNTRDNNVI